MCIRNIMREPAWPHVCLNIHPIYLAITNTSNQAYLGLRHRRITIQALEIYHKKLTIEIPINSPKTPLSIMGITIEDYMAFFKMFFIRGASLVTTT